jgi:hypothetical protein
MRLRSLAYFFIFPLLFLNINSNAAELADTIRLKPIVKKKSSYPLQPVVLKTSPTSFLWGGLFPYTSEYRLATEIASTRTQSEQISFSLLGKNIFLKMIEKATGQSGSNALKVSGWRLQYTHKFYLVSRRRAAPYGFYIAPHFSYLNAKISPDLNHYYHQSYLDVKHWNANIIIGVQAGKLHRLTLDVYGGIGYKTNTIYYHVNTFNIFKYDTSDLGPYYNNHLNIIFDINLGYSF